MNDFFKKIYIKIENNRFKILILFLVFLLFVTCRNFLEIINSSWYSASTFSLDRFIKTSIFLFIHWTFGYIMVFFIVFSCYRYIVKMQINKILYFSLSSVILMIAVLTSFILKEKMNLAYLDIHNLGQATTSIFSLFFLDKNNFPMFIEMILLFIGCPFFSYKVSKSWGRAIANTLAIFFLLAAFIGFIYICPNKKCLFFVESDIIVQFLAFYWAILSFLSFIVFIFPEFIKYIKLKKRINPIFFVFGFVIYLPLLVFLLNITRYLFDILFVSITYFIFYIIFVFIITNIKEKKYFDVILFLVVYDLIIFLLISSLVVSKLV